MSEYVIDRNIFSRYDMYKFFLQEPTKYNDNGDKVCTFDEYYRLEKYFATLFNCDCTDCGGKDISRACNVETTFRNIYGTIKVEDMV